MFIVIPIFFIFMSLSFHAKIKLVDLIIKQMSFSSEVKDVESLYIYVLRSRHLAALLLGIL